MRTTHNTIRAISIAIGLGLLVVTGTAAMIGMFSGSVSPPGAWRPVVLAPAGEAATHIAGNDSLLYERVVRSDGSSQWVLTEMPAATQALLAVEERPLHVADVRVVTVRGGLTPVSYALTAGHTGLNKVLKNCDSQAATGAKAKVVGAYDLSCSALG